MKNKIHCKYLEYKSIDLEKEEVKNKLIEMFNLTKEDNIGRNFGLFKNGEEYNISIDYNYENDEKCSCYIDCMNTYFRYDYNLDEFTKIINKEIDLIF